MPLNVYINFNGNCREAVAFYAGVFEQPVPKMMTFADAPEDPQFTLPPGAEALVIHTALDIHGTKVMFSDTPPDMPFSAGGNISLVIESIRQSEIENLFRALSEGGRVEMELQETFWSPCYGMLTDRFGIAWQLSQIQ